MRITSLEVQQFGALHGRRFATDANAIVVFGRNERGKSSFHQALRTTLFGFSPAAAKLHPLASPAFLAEIDAGDPVLEVAATIESAAGLLTMERRMDASASSRLTLGGAAARDAAFVRTNEPVQGVGAVTAELFRDVYTLDPDSTRAFDRRLAPDVERLLLGGGALPDLPSVLELKQSVDAERASLWREDRRSKKTAVALLDARLAALQAEGRETRRIEEGLVRLETQLETSTTQLAKDEGALTEVQGRIASLQTIERAAHIAQTALDHDVDLKPFAGVPLESPVPMLADLEDAELVLEEPLQRLSEPAATLEPSDRTTLEHREAIAGLAREEARVERARTEAKTHSERAQEKRATARELERSLRAPSDGKGSDGAQATDADLRELRAWAAAWNRRASTGVDVSEGTATDAKTGRSWLIGVATGASAGGAAIASGAQWAGALAAAIAPTAAIALATSGGKAERIEPRSQEAAPQGLRGALADLGIAPALVSTPADLAAAVETLARAAALRAEAADLDRAEETLLESIEAEHGRWRGMLEALLPAAPRATWASAEDAPEILRAHLERAAHRIRHFEVDTEERRRATRERDRATERLRGLSERFEALRGALETAVAGETVLDRAFERVAAAHAARERARGALRELRGGEAWTLANSEPRLQKTLSTALSTGRFDASELRALKDAAAELEDRILRGREELARLDERLIHERPKRTRSSIDSESRQLRTKRTEAMGRHRALSELSEALTEGERRHRAAHQPSILRGAGRWLEAITDGRYRSLAVDTSEGTSLLVESRETGGFVPCESPLSRGVREQVHLALRLGVAETADQGGEPLPLLLDEALVHWDKSRRSGFYRAWTARQAVAPGRTRQIFLFTCHEGLAVEAVERLGALRIDL